MLWLWLMLVGCEVVPGIEPPGDDDDATPIECEAEGEPGLTIVHDATHEPWDGDFLVERRYQGAVATVVALKWTGTAGGDPLGALTAEMVSDAGDVVATRSFDEAWAPCDPHGGVGFHELEVFFAYGGPMPEVDGLHATLTVTTNRDTATAQGTLRVQAE